MQVTNQNGYLFTNSEWFLAVITAVCPPVDEFSNYTCSWQQYSFNDNMQKLNLQENLELQYGDCTEEINIAVPINEQDPSNLVDSIVLMRQRGATDTIKNIFEFISPGSSGPSPTPTENSCFTVKSVQCNNNILQVVSSNAGGCLSCSGGMALFVLNTAENIPISINYAIPNNWSLALGDLANCGLQFAGNEFQNISGATLQLRVTLQYYWTPSSTSGASRFAFVCRNSDTNDIPVASFQASNNTNNVVGASNVFSLPADQTFQPYAFTDTTGMSIGGSGPITSILIEKLCL